MKFTFEDAEVAPAELPIEARPTRWAGFRGWAVAISVAVVFAFVIRVSVVQSFFIPSLSMAPTLQVDDHILVQRTTFDFNGINRGDLVVFDRPATADPAAPDTFIKRVIATAGETVRAADGKVSVDGVLLDEPYTAGSTSSFPAVTLGANEIFVMGDNRTHSSDSRVFGPIQEDSIIGSAFARTWPLTHIGTVG